MQLLGLFFQFGKAAVSIDVDSVLGDVADVESLLELLRRPHHALANAL